MLIFCICVIFTLEVIFILVFQAEAPLYGIDWDAAFSYSDEAESVEVPLTGNPLTPSDYAQLCQEVNPSPDLRSGDYGIEEYCATVRFVHAKVAHDHYQ